MNDLYDEVDFALASHDEDLRFYQEVQQYRELRDLDYEMWSESLEVSIWYDFVERGELT